MIHKKMIHVSKLPVNRSVANLFELIICPEVKPSTQRMPRLMDIKKRTEVIKRFMSLKYPIFPVIATLPLLRVI